MKRIIILSVVCGLLSGCFAKPRGPEIPIEYIDVDEDPIPGTVRTLWVEPMPQTVRVPGQLDPKGIIYIPSHNSLVEIRPGRTQRQQFPGGAVQPNAAPTAGQLGTVDGHGATMSGMPESGGR